MRALQLASLLGILLGAVSLTPARGAGEADEPPRRTITFETGEGTWMNLDVSPDGRTILFDLLGDLYTLPITGGEAKLLLGGPSWDHQGRFSPDGKQIVFVSDRDNGMFNLWLMNIDGTNVRALTKEPIVNMNGPTWTPDGQYVVAAKFGSKGPGAFGPAGIFMFDLRGGSGVQLRPEGVEPALSQDSRSLFFSAYADGGWNIHRLDRTTGQAFPLTKGGSYGGVRPVLSPDGRTLAYARLQDGVTSLRLRDLHAGDDRELVPRITDLKRYRSMAIGFVPAYVFAPDGSSILIPIDGKIHRIELTDGSDHVIPFRARVVQEVAAPIRNEYRVEDGDLKVRILRWPSLSLDGKQLVFSALGKLYLADLPDGHARRLTSSREREYCPTFSPDGRWIAYTTWTDAAYGHVKLLSTDGSRQQTLTTVAGRYGDLAWSRDGTKLAFVRGNGGERRGEWENWEACYELCWSDLSSAEPHSIATVAPASIYHRWFPSIAFTPDGTRLCFSESTDAEMKMSLLSVRLDGTDRRRHAHTPLYLDLIPSPEGRHVAIVRPNGIQVASLPSAESTTTEIDLGGAVPLTPLIPVVGAQPAWHGEETLTWCVANRLFSLKLGEAEPKPIAEIQLTTSRAKPSGTIAFHDARIVTMRGDEVIKRGTIVVVGNRIVAVGPTGQVRIPTGSTVVDARGMTIIPGLVDTHAHMHGGNKEYFPEQKWEYLALLAYGVTTTLDPQAPTLDVFAESELVEAGELIGPRIYSTGRGITGADSSIPFLNFGIDSLEDARRIVRAYHAFGPVMLKDYVNLRRERHQWLARATREHGIRLTAEGNGDFVLDLTLILDGYTAFEHDLPLRLQDDVIQFLARSGAYYTPTLLGTYGDNGVGARRYFELTTNVYDDPKLRRFTPALRLDGSRRVARIPENEWFFKTCAEGAAKIVHAGGRVTVGGHGELHGLGTIWEAWGIAMGGLTPLETIRVATLYGAEKLGLQRDLGSLEVGKLADFVVLEANPLEDIHNLTRQRCVVKNGFVYDSESMARLWPAYQAPPKLYWMSDADRARFRAREPKPLVAGKKPAVAVTGQTQGN